MSPSINQSSGGAAEAPDSLRLGPEQGPRRLVLLHGWGADADDLLDLGEELVGPAVSLVALRAPQSHPAGVGRQWYPLSPAPDWTQLPDARLDLRRRLEELAATVPLASTALLGFSQGAAMALDAAHDLPLAALIACSGYPHPDWHSGRSATPVLLTHGEQDPMVAPGASAEVERALKAAGGSVQRLTFPGGHGIDPTLLPSLRAFLDEGWRG
ncbi:MAG: alpha/beta hydrolase [Cyanobium sp.]